MTRPHRPKLTQVELGDEGFTSITARIYLLPAGEKYIFGMNSASVKEHIFPREDFLFPFALSGPDSGSDLEGFGDRFVIACIPCAAWLCNRKP